MSWNMSYKNKKKKKIWNVIQGPHHLTYITNPDNIIISMAKVNKYFTEFWLTAKSKCNCSEQLAIKLRDGCWTLLSVVNKLWDNIVNNDLKDIFVTIPGPDVIIAQDEDFDNGNKESEMDETA